MTSNEAQQTFLTELEFVCSVCSKFFLYPFYGISKVKLIGYYFICFLLLFTSFQLFFTLLYTGFTDLIEIINIAPNIGVCVMTTIKYNKVHNHKEMYEKIFNHFHKDLWKIVPECFEKNQKTVIKYTKISKIINRLLVYYSLPLIIMIDSVPFVMMIYETTILDKGKQYFYPFDGWYPFDKVKWFYAVYIWESFMTALVIWIYVCVDMVTISYILYICMELKLLGNCLEDLITAEDVDNIIKRHNVKETHDNIKKKLKVIIKRHDFLDKLSSELNNVLGDVMLVNYTFGSIFICLTAFTFTVVDEINKSLRYFFFFCSLLVAIFDQCIIGQVLGDHSVKLSEAIYSSNWPYADTQTRRTIVMLMMRMQRPFKLTANGYLVMNLNTFTRICSSSYQFFNLLRTIYKP